MPDLSQNHLSPRTFLSLPKPAQKYNTLPLEDTVNLVSVPPMSIAKEPTVRDRLLAIDGLEAGNHKHAREEARGLSEG